MIDTKLTYENSKLAKSKGLNYICEESYYNKLLALTSYHMSSNKDNEDFDSQDLIFKPTQTLAQKWLRETHRIVVEVRISAHAKYIVDVINDYSITHIGMGNMSYFTNIIHLTNDFKGYETYEEALEIGIGQGLQLIKIK